MPKQLLKQESWRTRRPPQIQNASEGIPKEPVKYNVPLMRAELGLNPFPEERKPKKKTFIEILVKKLAPPSERKLKGQLCGRFRKWCVRHGIDPDKVTTSGSAFRRYRAEVIQQSEEALQRLDSVSFLFAQKIPVPMGMEAATEMGAAFGRNACLWEYVEKGKIPDKCTEDRLQFGWKQGWNNVRLKLIDLKRS
ncbi:MAG: hypothetical protein AAB691_03950 [Patescibacteria group bacterium]